MGTIQHAGRTTGPRPHVVPALAVAVGAALAAAIGLASGGVYGDDTATVEMLRGFDVVTLALAVPALLLSLWAERRGAVIARLVVASLLAYVGYTFLYHLLAPGFTDLLLLHASLLTATVVALGLTLRGCVTPDLEARVRHLPVRVPAVVLGMLAVALGAMWAWASIAWAMDETMPAGSALVESDTVVHLGIVLDLTILVPLYAAAAVLLWRRRAVGLVLAALALVAGTLHQISYVAALLFQHAADIPGSVVMDPYEPVILALYVVATAVLLRRPRGVGAVR